VSAESPDLRPENVPAESLADRLRTAKLKGGIKNDADFAKIAGVARSSMSAYLNGKQIPKPPTLHRIANATGVDLNWLLGTEHTSPLAIPGDVLGQDCALLTPEMLDSPVNFPLLMLSIWTYQANFEGKPKPTLRQVLDWIAGPYALHASIKDLNVKFGPLTPKDTET
jgi:transcriptional regulator with XRE-family HTH domain